MRFQKESNEGLSAPKNGGGLQVLTNADGDNKLISLPSTPQNKKIKK